MNKKALAMRTLVELIFFAIVTLLIAFPLLIKLVGLFVGEPELGTKKSFDALAIEIDNLNNPKTITVPVYIDKEHTIDGYDSKTSKDLKPISKECKKDGSCLCICSKKSKCSPEDKKMKCVKLELELKNSFSINAKLDEKDNAIVQNCELSRDNTGVSVLCS